MAPRHGMEGIESRFARRDLELANSGLSYFRYDPGLLRVRVPERRAAAEGDDLDAVRAGLGRADRPGRTRTASHWLSNENRDTELKPGWWPDA